MTDPGTLRDDDREPTQPIELEEVEPPRAARPSQVAGRLPSAPPPVPPQALGPRRPGSAPPSVPPMSPASSDRVRASGVHRVERPGVHAPGSPARPASLPPPPPAGMSSRPPAVTSVLPVAPPAAFGGQKLPAPDASPSGLGTLAAGAELRALQQELRSANAHRDRLRLQGLRQQQRIDQLEAELATSRAEVKRLEQALDAARRESALDNSDLKRIQGIGPAFERALKQNGVTNLETIAAWTAEDIVTMARTVGTTPHRIMRDGWVRSARELLGLPAHE